MIVVDTLTDRMLFMGIGCVLGLILGWVSRTMKYAREARNDSHIAMERAEQIMDERDESGRSTINAVALMAVVLLVAVSAIISGLAAGKVSSAQESINNSQTCTESVLTNVIRTVNERTTYSNDVSKADLAQNKAFLEIATASLKKPPVTMKESIEFVTDYRDKLNAYLKAIEKAQNVRVTNPYPEIDDYRECLNKARED